MTSIILACFAVALVIIVIWAFRFFHLRAIAALNWGDLTSRPKMIRCCRRYLKRQKWNVAPAWHLMTDLHIKNGASGINLVCISAGKQIDAITIKDAVATANATHQAVVLVTAAELNPREAALANASKLPIFFYKDLGALESYRVVK